MKVMMTMMMIINNKTIGNQETRIGADGFQIDVILTISTGQVQI
jgi:hypothetical protein